jgi:hypothetical protein
MHILLVLAHPLAESFAAAVARTARETLEERGHTVDLRDLYQEEFDPRLTAAQSAPGDLTGRNAGDAGKRYVRPVSSVSEIGSDLIRFPVIAKIALHTAGAMGGVAGSPMPPQRLPPERVRWVSISGASAIFSMG